MDKQFKTGDRVVLVSGGPTMTVSEIDGDHIVCIWFPTMTEDVKSYKFHKDELKIYETPPIIIGKRKNSSW